MNFVMFGRIVTMDPQREVIADGAIYVENNVILAVTERNEQPPVGFTSDASVETNGTIFPGLIELHNHLSYDSLPMWKVPTKFTNRNQWQDNADYISMVSAPMGIIAKSKDPRLLAAVARYAETKCLLGGVTTSQGIALKGDNLDTFYRSAMRVVDDPGDPQLPRAATHISDIDASEWESFYRELKKVSCLLLHLSEGLDSVARDAFLALKRGEQWAITSALAGIHCSALEPQDFKIMKSKGGSVIWSPLSNFLLYGGTTNIKAARSAGIDIALGSDWSPSGSKNLLNELKVAQSVNDALQLDLTPQDIVSMVTINAAKIIKWDALVGSIAAGKRADFTVIAGSAPQDPYLSLIKATELDLALVIVDGRPVLGTPEFMSSLSQAGETINVGTEKRVISYGIGDIRVPTLTFAETEEGITDALARLPSLLADEKKGRGLGGHILRRQSAPALHLALDEEHLHGNVQRLNLPLHGKPTGPAPMRFDPSSAVKPLTPDPVTVAADANYASLLQSQMNIPVPIKSALREYY